MSVEFCMECNQKLGTWTARFGGNNTVFCKKCFKSKEIVNKHVELNSTNNTEPKANNTEPKDSQPVQNKITSVRAKNNTNKFERYCAWAVGSILILGVMFINNSSFVRYGFFASNINQTMMFDLLQNIFGGIGKYSNSRNYSYFSWFVCFSLGILLSWKCRFDVAEILKKLLMKIHNNI